MDKNFISTSDNIPMKLALAVFAGAIILGGLSGWGISKIKSPNKTTNEQLTTATDTQAKKTVGVANKKNFKDMVEGVLKEGGVEGEGNFFIERPGGPSQNAYLTSTTIDLSEFVGKKVKCWGETYKGEKVGWLMDVGLVEILE